MLINTPEAKLNEKSKFDPNDIFNKKVLKKT